MSRNDHGLNGGARTPQPMCGLLVQLNHAAAVALNYFAYNFIRIHRTLRVSPAMASGVTDHLWDAGELVGLLEAKKGRKERRENE